MDGKRVTDNQTHHDKSGQNQSSERFVPTCPICGEKHWPHPLVPCLNAKKAKEKAKAEALAKALAEKEARIEAKRLAKEQAYAEKLARIQAKEQGMRGGHYRKR
jgi:hypothetical protein